MCDGGRGFGEWLELYEGKLPKGSVIKWRLREVPSSNDLCGRIFVAYSHAQFKINTIAERSRVEGGDADAGVRGLTW